MTWTLAVDGRALQEDLGGLKRYTESLLPAMVGADANLRIHLLSHRPLSKTWRQPPFSAQTIPGSLSLPSRLLWETRLHRYLPDTASAFFSPMGLVPRTPLPTAITVHDTAFHTHAQLLPRRYRWYWRHIARRWHSADLVLAPSVSTRDGLAALGVKANRVVVTGEGPTRALLMPEPGSSTLQVTTEIPEHLLPFRRYLESEFVLFVGTIEPRKNLATLLAAMRQLKRTPRTTLVLAGRRGWGRTPEGLAQRPPKRNNCYASNNGILELGPVSDGELAYLYSRASVLALPSWTEGFGLPALEAMSAGVPVIASKCGALPEVLAHAGVLLPPDDATLWANEINALLDDPSRRQRLITTGLDRAEQFSWEATARTSLASLRRLIV